MPKVVIYIPVEDYRALEAEGKEPKAWVREMVKKLLERKRQEQT